MDMARRSFIAGTAATAVIGPAPARGMTERAETGRDAAPAGGRGTMYGLIGKMTAQPGKRDALTAILVEGLSGMPGCLSYVVANDPGHADMIWITEVWETKEAHAASLQLPMVRDAITRGRPLIAGMETVAKTTPVGGLGI